MSNKIIYFLNPSSYCMGVDRAINGLLKIVDENPKHKIFCVHEIVHNPNVINYFEKKGVIFVDNVDEVDNNNSIVVFSAHGTNREILDRINSKFLKVYNLECPLVTKVYNELNKVKDNIDVLFYIGKNLHQETLGVTGYAKYLGIKYYIISSLDDIPKIDSKTRIGILSQTTLNYEYVNRIFSKIKSIYINSIFPPSSDVCKATYERQSVIIEFIDMFDGLIVIGGKNSSNTSELVNIGKELGKIVYFGEKLTDILKFSSTIFDIDRYAITGGASTPKESIKEIFDYFVNNGYRPEYLSSNC